jgi:threonine dehydratase
MHAALEKGEPVDVSVSSVAQDSLGARRVGALPFEVAKTCVDRVALVPDDAIVDAQRLLWRTSRIAAEPGGAAAFGALLAGAYVPGPSERVGVLVCGGNVDPKTLAVESG